jgi:lysozyme
MRLRSFACALVASGVVAGCGDQGQRARENSDSTASAMSVCGQDTVHGMDVSHYDGTIDWPTAKAAGIDFAFVKATESTSYVDPTFGTNWSGMKAAGVVRGAYHFFRANADPIAQANHVVQTVGPLEEGDLPIVLDLETADGQSGSAIADAATKFLDAVTATTGHAAIVYASPGFVNGTVGNPSAFAKYTLWVANWGVSCPNVPAPWTTWSFWQHTDHGTVNGVPASAVDLNTFNGTLAQLRGTGSSGGHDAGSSGSADAGSSGHGGGGDSGGTQGGTEGPPGGSSSSSSGGGAPPDPPPSHSADQPQADFGTGPHGGCSVLAGRPGKSGDFAPLFAAVVGLMLRRRRARAR